MTNLLKTRKRLETKLKKLSLEDKCYIAGLIDGEGCITVYYIKNPNSPQGFRLRPQIQIGNTNKLIIYWLKETTGVGVLSIHKQSKAKWKTCYSWYLYVISDIKALLEEILPYLKVKKHQAELLLEFCKLRLKNIRKWYSDREIQIYQELKKLNKKGRT